MTFLLYFSLHSLDSVGLCIGKGRCMTKSVAGKGVHVEETQDILSEPEEL